MKTKITALLLFTAAVMVFGQKNYWSKTENVRSAELRVRQNMPDKYLLYHLDFEKIRVELSNAPDEASKREDFTVKFPDSDGNIRTYIVQEASVMEPELQAKFPEIRSYIGWQKGNKANTVRFSISPQQGMHVMYFDGWQISYLDSYSADNSLNIIYKRNDIRNTARFECGVKESLAAADQSVLMKAPLVQDGLRRTFRLAVAGTAEYTIFHGGTVPLAISAMATTMTRVNGIYEKTFSVRMVMVGNNNQIVYTNANTDPYTNGNASAMLSQNQTTLDNVIGSANYDIGHVFGTNSGGVAYLQSVCANSVKARGVTGSGAPVGDPFDVDYVAHEMGHQFGGNHSFRGNTGACSGNTNSSTAMEPGGGTTIMAYAGICGVNDIQFNSDPYFHAVNVTEMYNFIAGAGNTCAAAVVTGNNVPAANAGSDYSIPKGTAFVLTGTGSDPDGNPLTYLWEQYDSQSNVQPPVSTATAGPVYRSRIPSNSPKRYFPELASVVANNLTPAWEVTPSVARTLNFNLLVSDNVAGSGQSAKDAMVVTVTNDGPFTVTSHSANTSYPANAPTTVTWNVAGTNAGTIATQNVDIVLSTDGGLTFNTVLAANTPNDGSQSVVLPDSNASNARIMVRAVGNIFYALNSSPFSITGALATNETVADQFRIYPNPASHEVTVELPKSLKNVGYQITDVSGRMVKKGKLDASGIIKLNGYQTGNYILQLLFENGQSHSEKLIIKR